ncbi:tetratricopeptide repeat protein [bacterium]|nr:tetratricopeptide repeat protein [bacterium]
MTTVDIDTFFNEGVDLYEQKQFKEAEEKFMHALEIDPNSDDVKYNLALVYFATERYDMCVRFIQHIHDVDCSELITELEKVHADTAPDLPELIPQVCDDCPHYHPNEMLKEKPGHCLFYGIARSAQASCFAFELVQEGQISLKEVESRKGNPYQAVIDPYTEQLRDEYLPEKFICQYCSIQVALSETEQQSKRFICPECKKANEVGQDIKELDGVLINESDDALFMKLLSPNHYQYVFVQAAKKEILRRGIDLGQSEKFLSMLKDLDRE